MQFGLKKRVVVKHMKIFENVCMEFHFLVKPGTTHRNEILFARQCQIFKLNLDTEQTTTYYQYENPLNLQPQNFDTNLSQDIFIVASPDDALYVNTAKNLEVDLDDLHQIGLIKEIIFDESSNHFFILANKYQGLIGFFVLKFP